MEFQINLEGGDLKMVHIPEGEREFEIGKDEAWFANVKRTYDEYQSLAVDLARKLNLHFDKLVSDAQSHDNVKQTIAEQALQNAVETANMVSKQAVRHGDIAIDRQWNVDEVSALTAKSGVQADVIQAIVAAVLVELKKDE